MAVDIHGGLRDDLLDIPLPVCRYGDAVGVAPRLRDYNGKCLMGLRLCKVEIRRSGKEI